MRGLRTFSTGVVMAILLVGLLSGQSILQGVQPAAHGPEATRPEATRPEAEDAAAASSAGWDGLRSSGLLDDEVLARLDPILAEAGVAGTALPPSELESALRLAGADDVERLPVPAPPPGGQPLLDALQAYAGTVGIEAHDLAPAIATLRLDSEAEAALAQLVLAYIQAIGLQEEATSKLTPQERLLLSADPGAMLAWQQDHPAATRDAFEDELLRLTAEKVDGTKMMQAGDLLARTVDAVRGPLANPPTPAPEATELTQRAADPLELEGWDLARHAAGNGSLAVDPPASLDEALRGLVAAYGLPETALPDGRLALPASLDHAVAGIVAAQTAGIHAQDGPGQARALLDAAEAAEPTLRAWSALLSIPAGTPSQPDLAGMLTNTFSPQPDPVALLAQAQGRPAVQAPEARPLAELLADLGLDASDAATAAASLPPHAAAALALLLTAEQDLQASHAAALEGLTPVQQLGIAAGPHIAPLLAQTAWNATEAAWVQAWAEGMAALDEERLSALHDAQAAAAAAAAQAAGLLLVPASAPDLPEVGGVSSTASSDPNCPAASPFSRCQDNVYLELDVGSGILVTGPGSTNIDGRLAGGDAHIILDLGGDDVYTVSAGAATEGLGIHGSIGEEAVATIFAVDGAGGVYGPFNQSTTESINNAAGGRTLAIVVDADGDDTYTTALPAAQGVGIGLGAVGILWDRTGDDTYAQVRNDAGLQQFAQGVGGHGGLGLLVDEEGTDSYHAPDAIAQGVGWSPVFVNSAWRCNGHTQDSGIFGFGTTSICIGNANSQEETTAHNNPRDLGGTGALVDLGQGEDSFHALLGQGHADSYATIGILYDAQGATQYRTETTSFASQGGRGETFRESEINDIIVPFSSPAIDQRPAGLAVLLDLGGEGDTYNSPRFADGEVDEETFRTFVRHESQERRKGDDSLWIDAAHRGLSLGLDTTLEDEDGDQYANFVELLAGSDPHDDRERPEDTIPALIPTVVEAVMDVVAGAQKTLNQTESELRNQTSFLDPDEGFLFSAPLLCPADGHDACGGEDVCPPDNGTFCVSLLSIGDAEQTRHRRPAIISIDLGGDDTYETVVAGPGDVWVQGDEHAYGSTSIDIGGHDTYDTPSLTKTQAFAEGTAASLLLDLAGDDVYAASRRAQGAWEADGADQGGVALLVDFGGDDTYSSGVESQGHVKRGDHESDRQAIGGLLDLGGDDSYLFATQARAALQVDAPAFAFLLDAAGQDTYDAQGVVDPVDGDVFASQGRIDATDPAGRAVAAFADIGDEHDTYLVHGTGGEQADVSDRKNDVTRGQSAEVRAYFTDGPASMAQDPDEDGLATAAEMLAGTDPRDDADKPVGGPDDTLITFLPPGELVGLNIPGLIIGGRETNEYRDYASFIVDLGGDDRYLAPGIGGTALASHGTGLGETHSVSLVLDIGGDDEYAPEPCRRTYAFKSDVQTVDTEPMPGSGNVFIPDRTRPQGGSLGPTTSNAFADRAYTFCPSLGGSVAGVAVLADDAGDNDFRSASWVNVTVDARDASGNLGDRDVDVRAWGVSQGAAMFEGVGMLLTWGERNDFRGELHVRAEEKNTTNEDPRAFAFGVHQGAGWQRGSGLLASLGQGDDRYESITTATAPQAGGDGGEARDHAQGAGIVGTGILLVDGGSNEFAAPSGHAQGYAGTLPTRVSSHPRFGGVGLLWSGAGDDTYIGRDASQGAAGWNQQQTSIPAAGMLVDGGGNDRYIVLPAQTFVRECNGNVNFCDPPQGTALSQGAGRYASTGILLDWAGDDQYRAPGRNHVQGIARETGLGLLLDINGNDVYEAGGLAQGAVAQGIMGSGLTETQGTVGTLADLGGRDSYTLGEKGQGYDDASRPAMSGVFLDVGGTDRYNYGGDKTPHTVATGEPSDGDNDWTWTSGGNGFGVDQASIELALAAYEGIRTDPMPATDGVSLCVSPSDDPEDCVAEASSVEGTVSLFVVVDPPEGTDVQRVSLLLGGQQLGVAEPAGGNLFRMEWDTRSGAPAGVSDGPYTLVPTAFVSPAQALPGQSPAAAPDGIQIEGEPIDVTVDNPPTAKVTLSSEGVSPHGSPVVLSVDVSADAPEGENDARVEVILHPRNINAAPFKIFDGWLPNGTTPIQIDGRCPDDVCPDDQYDVEVMAEDHGDASVTLPLLPLLIDGSPPTSEINMPAMANEAFKGAGGALTVLWSTGEDLSGVRDVVVVQLDADDEVVQVLKRSGSTHTASLPGVSSGDTVRLVSVAVDNLGNTQHPCENWDWATPPACAAGNGAIIRSVFVDFVAPSIQNLRVDPPAVRPGATVGFFADVTDPEASLQDVTLSVDGPWRSAAQEMSDATDDQWQLMAVAPEEPSGVEEPFIYKVTASDEAGNEQEIQAGGLFDSLPPRLSTPAVVYVEDEQDLGKGKPGAQAEIVLRVEDADFDVVTADVTPLHPDAAGADKQQCESDAGGLRWICHVPIPEDASDDVYDIVLTAVDAAGNTNATTAKVVVESSAPAILDANVTAVGTDFVEIAWNTSTPATAWVEYGKTSELGRATSATTAYSTEHRVRVTGLSPGSQYHVQPRSSSQAGVDNDTAAALQAETLSAFSLSLPGFPEDAEWSRGQDIAVAIEFLLDGSAVSTALKVQGVGQATDAVTVDAGTLGEGAHDMSLNTLAFADGQYRIIVEGARQGDVQQVVSPAFRIDNTAPVLVAGSPRPGAAVGVTTPTVELDVVDPLREELPAESTLEVVVDEVATDVEGAYDAQGRLAFVLPELAPGDHDILVRVADRAGNVGETAWSFRVDPDIPVLTGPVDIDYVPGPDAARPGGAALVHLNVTDASGVASVALDFTQWGGNQEPLIEAGSSSWSGEVDLPDGLPHGDVVVPVRATDELGNEGVAGEALLTVDAEAPEFVERAATATGLTAIAVDVETSEPAVVVASIGELTNASIAGTGHSFAFGGLTPGKQYDVVVEATDLAGNTIEEELSVSLPIDSDAPSAPSEMTASSSGEGEVLLSWKPATDNAGILSYEVAMVRDGNETHVASVPADKTEFIDGQAPAGRDVEYRVHAVDVAGLEGPAAKAMVKVHAVPKLEEGSISPHVGNAKDPFTIEVLYRHAAGREPDRIEFLHGSERFPLQRTEDEDCQTGCRFSAQVRLPPMSTVDAHPESRIEVETDGVVSILEVDSPLVTLGSGAGFHSSEKEASAWPISFIFAALAAALILRRVRP